MVKLKLFRIYDVEYDENCVISAKKQFVADLKDEDEALKYPKEMENLYIIKFNENDEPIGIHGMVFGSCPLEKSDELYKEDGSQIPPSLDVAEWDFRVIASVAFNSCLI